MQLCLKAKYVSEDPAVRLRYCVELGFGATQESAKSIPAAQFVRNVDFYARATRRAREAGTKLATHSPYASPKLPDGRRHLTKPLWGGKEFGALFEAQPPL